MSFNRCSTVLHFGCQNQILMNMYPIKQDRFRIQVGRINRVGNRILILTYA